MPIDELKPRTARISSLFTFVQPVLFPNTYCAYQFVSPTIVVSTALEKNR